MHPVTIHKASLMTGSMRRVWALRHQAGIQCTLLLNGPGIRWLLAMLLAQHPSPNQWAASRVRLVISALRHVSVLSNVTPRCLGSEQNGRLSLLKLTFSSF